MVTVFIPSSPTPVTGYTITVKRKDAIELPITIDEALKFTVSGGVILPLNQRPIGSDGTISVEERLTAPETSSKETP
jgi:uncharacterized membrane protein